MKKKSFFIIEKAKKLLKCPSLMASRNFLTLYRPKGAFPTPLHGWSFCFFFATSPCFLHFSLQHPPSFIPSFFLAITPFLVLCLLYCFSLQQPQFFLHFSLQYLPVFILSYSSLQHPHPVSYFHTFPCNIPPPFHTFIFDCNIPRLRSRAGAGGRVSGGRPVVNPLMPKRLISIIFFVIIIHFFYTIFNFYL